MSATSERLIRLGVISSVHGVRGQVKIRSFTAHPEDMTAYGPLRDSSGRVYGISITGGTNDALIASIDGITSRDEAEKLRNTELFVPRSALPEPGDNQFYHEDLIGLMAVTEDGKDFGRLIAISNFGAGDIAVLKLKDGDEEYLPFNKTTFPVIDIKNKKLVVLPPEILNDDEL